MIKDSENFLAELSKLVDKNSKTSRKGIAFIVGENSSNTGRFLKGTLGKKNLERIFAILGENGYGIELVKTELDQDNVSLVSEDQDEMKNFMCAVMDRLMDMQISINEIKNDCEKLRNSMRAPVNTL